MWRDLRTFLKFLEDRGELAVIKDEVDIKYDISAGLQKTCRIAGPALYFENVKDYNIPVVGGIYATEDMTLVDGEEVLTGKEIGQVVEATPNKAVEGKLEKKKYYRVQYIDGQTHKWKEVEEFKLDKFDEKKFKNENKGKNSTKWSKE